MTSSRSAARARRVAAESGRRLRPRVAAQLDHAERDRQPARRRQRATAPRCKRSSPRARRSSPRSPRAPVTSPRPPTGPPPLLQVTGQPPDRAGRDDAAARPGALERPAAARANGDGSAAPAHAGRPGRGRWSTSSARSPTRSCRPRGLRSRSWSRRKKLVRSTPSSLRKHGRFLKLAPPVVSRLDPLLTRLNPVADQLRVFTPETVGFFQNVADAASNYDRNGHLIRVRTLLGNTLPLSAGSGSLGPSDCGPGLLDAPYHRDPGVNECQPWEDWRDSLGEHGRRRAGRAADAGPARQGRRRDRRRPAHGPDRDPRRHLAPAGRARPR